MRLPDGRFQVRLPLKENTRPIANTFHRACAALLRSEKLHDEQIRKTYVDFMAEYRATGLMKLCTSEEPRYYIPHLPVFRPENSSTKLRVVFNASTEISSGISLNEAVFNGPALQPELFNTLLRFRMHIVAFSANISKMYRQIAVHPDDRLFNQYCGETTQRIRSRRIF